MHSAFERTPSGRLQLGAGRQAHDAEFIFFHRHAANVPDVADAQWIYAQRVRWGQVAPSARAQALAANAYRPDLYRRSAALPPSVISRAPAFDCIAFSADDIGSYLAQFEVHTPFTAAQPS